MGLLDWVRLFGLIACGWAVFIMVFLLYWHGLARDRKRRGVQ